MVSYILSLVFAISSSVVFTQTIDNVDNVQTGLHSVIADQQQSIADIDLNLTRALLSDRNSLGFWRRRRRRTRRRRRRRRVYYTTDRSKHHTGCGCKCGGNCNSNPGGAQYCYAKYGWWGIHCGHTSESDCVNERNWWPDWNYPCSWLPHTCQCEHGEPATGADCKAANAHSCKSCDKKGGYELSHQGGICNPITCHCNSDNTRVGTPLSGPSCYAKANAQNTNVMFCTNCVAGYHLKNSQCIKNTCKCPPAYGSPATGADCTHNNAHNCGSCKNAEGYVLNEMSRRCIPKQCTCNEGTASTGKSCPTHEGAYCSSCTDTTKYSDRNGVCTSCTICATGWRVRTACAATRDTECECDAGYAGTPCQPCVGNEYATGYGQQSCRPCPSGTDGYAANGAGNTGCKADTCQHPVPLPENSQVVEGSCPENGAHNQKCSIECVKGYHTSSMVPYECLPISGTTEAEYNGGSLVCKPWVCTCEHGQHTEGPACPADKTENCHTCNEGYHLDNGICKENKCTCDNGQFYVNTLCPVNGTERCKSCDNGYLLDTNAFACEARQCTCDDGVGAEGVECPANGENKCVDCFTGYHVAEEKCDANVCKCLGGVAATGEQCPTHNNTYCLECNDGYEYKDNNCLSTTTTTPAPMSCSDKTQGFISNGAEISGYLKSCPVGIPIVEKTNTCEKEMCFVDPDRFTCCRTGKCSCNGGNPTVWGEKGALECERDGQEDCQDCWHGYHLSAPAGSGPQKCLPDMCQCPNGVPATNPESMIMEENATLPCAEHGKTSCASCNAGYTLTGAVGAQTCEPNVCTCPNGNPTIASGAGGTLCEESGTTDCSSCAEGYQLPVPAALGVQICGPKICHSDGLPTGNEYDASSCIGVKTSQSCQISCAAGYTGSNSAMTCGNDQQFTGQKPECKPQPCKGDKSANIKNALLEGCDDIKVDGICTAKCQEGYTGDSQTYTCTADGLTGKDMDCQPQPCDASADPANGKAAPDCTKTLDSGATCSPACDAGYTLTGVTSCTAGKLTNAQCEASSCIVAQAPAFGTFGDCPQSPKTLASGATCQPECDRGYHATGKTSCTKASLTQTTCQAEYNCPLVYGQGCTDNFGQWTKDLNSVDYPGCEHFCNMKSLELGENLAGCELTDVMSDIRSDKGKYCLAHFEGSCGDTGHGNNAAATCTKYNGTKIPADQGANKNNADTPASMPSKSSAPKPAKVHHKHRHHQ